MNNPPRHPAPTRTPPRDRSVGWSMAVPARDAGYGVLVPWRVARGVARGVARSVARSVARRAARGVARRMAWPMACIMPWFMAYGAPQIVGPRLTA
jgi:hypothetical protein